MKVINIINLIPDYQYVTLYDAIGNEIAKYDGKDSLPETFNWETVIGIVAENNTIGIITGA